MTALRKFTFDLDLARPPLPALELPAHELDRLLAEAREAGFREGRHEALAEAEAQAAGALSAAAIALADSAAQGAAALDAHRAQTLREAAELALAVARKLVPALLARQPEAEIGALFADCLSGLDAAPHLVVRCHLELCDAIRHAAEDRIRASGFSGRLVVLGDPEIGLGDGRIEWADGGLVRDAETLMAGIEARISAYLATQGDPS